MLQFRVRYSTDISVLYREVGLLESRLKTYLALFLNDDKVSEAVDAGEEFLKSFVAHSSLPLPPQQTSLTYIDALAGVA
jgi:hypothetical protein